METVKNPEYLQEKTGLPSLGTQRGMPQMLLLLRKPFHNINVGQSNYI